jgi:predicted molibdopterin-dependent oxidoreductase YjgC
MGRRLRLRPALVRGPELTIELDGRPLRVHEGETVAAALVADGHAATRRTVRGEPRGLYCGMGVCFECLVVVDGIPNTRACMTWVREGMKVERQDGVAATRDDLGERAASGAAARGAAAAGRAADA